MSVTGMDCANCAKTIERGVATLPGIDSVQVSFATETLEARGHIARDQLADRIRQLGFGVAADPDEQSAATAGAGIVAFLRFLCADWHGRAAVAGSLALGVLAIAAATGIGPAATLLRDGQVCESCLGKSIPFPAVSHGCYCDCRP